MKRIYLFALISILAVACNSNKVIIDATVDGAKNGQFLIKILDVNTQKTIDTIKSDEAGKFKYSKKLSDKNPDFYYIYFNDKKIASLLLKAGDKVKINTDTLGKSLKIEGSDESILLSEAENSFGTSYKNFDSLSRVYIQAQSSGDKELESVVNYQLGSVYVKQKQASIKFLYKHPKSMALIMLLYQKFPGDLPVFADVNDALLYKKVYDSLSVAYPTSKYLPILKDEIDKRQNSSALSNKIMGASETGFPNITLPDNNAKMRSLSDFSGKVILLSFWTITDPKQRMFNKELMDVYQKYKSQGFEIYQVSVDTDKTAWSRALSDQNIPWISVCDGLGNSSTVVSTYNIQKVPTLFLIDKTGNIVAKDLYDLQLVNKIASLVK